MIRLNMSYDVEISARGSAEDLLIAEQALNHAFANPGNTGLDVMDILPIVEDAVIYVGVGNAAGSNRVQEAMQMAIENISTKININDIKHILIAVKNHAHNQESVNIIKHFKHHHAHTFEYDPDFGSCLFCVPWGIGYFDGTETEKELEITIIAADRRGSAKWQGNTADNDPGVELPAFLRKQQEV